MTTTYSESSTQHHRDLEDAYHAMKSVYGVDFLGKLCHLSANAEDINNTVSDLDILLNTILEKMDGIRCNGNPELMEGGA